MSTAAVKVSVIKELLYALSFTQTVGVGELANIIIMLPYSFRCRRFFNGLLRNFCGKFALFFHSKNLLGELANIIIMLPYILIPSIIYKKHKGIKSVLISLAIASVTQAVISIPVNYLPAYIIAFFQLPPIYVPFKPHFALSFSSF